LLSSLSIEGDPGSEPVEVFEEQVQAAGQDDQQHY
jgi:hypothetical protein